MYFFTYQQLKQRLRSRSISDREALPYLIASAAIPGPLGMRAIESVTVWDGVSACLTLVAAIGGGLYAYSMNGGKYGYDLIQKCCILGWVVAVRVGIVFLAAVIIAGEVFGLVSQNGTGPLDVIMIFLGEVIFFQRLGRHIADTATRVIDQPVNAAL